MPNEIRDDGAHGVKKVCPECLGNTNIKNIAERWIRNKYCETCKGTGRVDSLEEKVAEIIASRVRENLDRLGLLEELEAESNVSFVEFSKELTKEIITLTSESQKETHVVCDSDCTSSKDGKCIIKPVMLWTRNHKELSEVICDSYTVKI